VTIFSYIIEHDLGFAPNPFHGVCTLACCKPRIRKKARVGDYVLGTGAVKPKLRGHLTYWMRVDEIMTFDEYWVHPRFRRKKPVMLGTTYLRYGDNIYHRDDGKEFHQEDSFHSLEDGSVSLGDLRRDTATTDKVLIGRDFAYWGRAGITLPDELRCFVLNGPGHKYDFDEEEIAAFMVWLGKHPQRGYIDEPAHWQFLYPAHAIIRNFFGSMTRKLSVTSSQ
jgi:putative DNA base modification enzyme with NMAD domain